jgi:hypothetical protein
MHDHDVFLNDPSRTCSPFSALARDACAGILQELGRRMEGNNYFTVENELVVTFQNQNKVQSL